MVTTLRRLNPRGPAARGVVVDADGAALGPDCLLVRRTTPGYQALSVGEAATIQAALRLAIEDPHWLFKQCRRIAEALAKGETALAQIYGLHIPIVELTASDLRRLELVARFAKANFDPDEPRIPKGQPGAGQWTFENFYGTGVGKSNIWLALRNCVILGCLNERGETGGTWRYRAGRSICPSGKAGR